MKKVHNKQSALYLELVIERDKIETGHFPELISYM
jgi:hypothetical protein